MQGDKNQIEENNPAPRETGTSSLRPTTDRALSKTTIILTKLWSGLTASSAAVQPAEERRKAQLVSAMLLIVLIALGIHVIARGAISPVFLFLIFGGYILSRTKYHHLAAIITIFLLSAPAYLGLNQETAYVAHEVFAFQAWVALSLVLSSILFHTRGFLIVAGLHICASLLMPVLYPQLTYKILISSLGFITTLSLLILIVIQQRDQLERDRQAKLIQINAELRNSEERYRSLVENSPIPIFVHHQGRFVYLNPAAVRLYGADNEIQLINKPLADFTPSGHRELLTRWMEDTIDQPGQIQQSELSIVNLKGQEIDVEVTAMQVMFNQAPSELTICVDITDRLRAEREIRANNEALEQRVIQRTSQLLAANKELNEFAYIVSHDLKAPLRAINQISGWLQMDYQGALDRKGQELLGLLMSRSERMHNLIDGILEYSKIGRSKDVGTRVDLNTLVQGVIDGLAPPEHIQVLIADELPTIIGDVTRLTQIFQNLISNAIQYIDKPAGQVTIDCQEQDDQWRFSVADNGPGISEKYHLKVFQMFQTLEARDDNESTGIGLALVKKIVAGWNGKIWIESIDGEGSTFFFTIPKGEIHEAG